MQNGTNSHWMNDGAEMKRFTDAVDGYFIRRSLVSFAVSEADLMAFRNDALQRWFDTGVNLAQFPTTEMASAMFAGWGDVALHEKSPEASATKKLFVSMSRQIGADTYTIGLEQEYTLDTPFQLAKAYEEMRGIVGAEFARIVPASGAAGAAAGVVSSEKEIAITHVAPNMWQGKRYYKAFGAPYEKFGVPIWEEVLLKASIVPAMIPDNGVPMTGWKARVLMEGNKPKKVLELVRA